MAGILVNECKLLLLDERLAAPPYDDAEVGLVFTPTVPDVDTVLADVTPVTGTGYASVPLTTWSPAVMTDTDRAISLSNMATFHNSGGGDWSGAIGWYIFSPGAAVLIRIGLFPSVVVVHAGETWEYQPFVTLTGE